MELFENCKAIAPTFEHMVLYCIDFQISQHKWAWPFMQPVDVEGLGLHDYYEVRSISLSIIDLSSK